ncbi:MAG: hypothetical protein KBS56_05960 [Clostridiales bacterium]|nr:hypothetical protein [Candidatus Crickella equi]
MRRSIINRKRLAVVLACAMLVSMFGSTCVVWADAAVSKDETVYVITGENGDATDVIVSDHLVNNGKAAVINDVSDLKNIENVKGDEKFTQDGNKLEWAADGKDIFYQGKSDKAIPVQMSLRYSMNGEPFTGQEMQGKKGNFKISITYSNNSESSAAAVPFIVLSGMLMEDDNYSNLSINSGKIVDDGEKSIVVGMAAPGLTNRLSAKVRNAISDAGLGSEVVVTGHTNSFDITDIMSIATNSLFDDVDMGEFADLDYDDQIKELDKGSKKLVNGSNELFNGLTQLNDKVPALKQGIGTLTAGSKALADGTKQLKDLKSGLDTIANGQALASGGIRQIYNGLKDSKAGLKGGLDQMGAGADKLCTEVPGALAGSNQEIQAALQIVQKYENTIAPKDYAAVLALLGNDKVGDITGAQLINSSVAASVSQGATDLKAGAVEMSGGVDKLIAGFEGDGTQANPGVLNAMDSLTSGTKQIAAAIGDEKTFDSLIGGAEQLAMGMGQLNEQTGTLAAAIKQLTDGSGQISDGMEQLYEEGIKTVVDMYNNELKGQTDGLEDTLNAGKSYNNYSMLGAGMDGNVKFIFKTVVAI